MAGCSQPRLASFSRRGGTVNPGRTIGLVAVLGAVVVGSEARPIEPAAPRPSVELVTAGLGTAYSSALDRIAFERFNPTIIGGPEFSGRNDHTGTFELWIADPDGRRERCLSCRDVPRGPRLNQHKGAPTWHPSGEWLVAGVEMPIHAAPHAKCHAGTGAYVDLWAVSADGRRWVQLTRYAPYATRTRFQDRPVGALIPRFSRSGRQLVWAEMIGYDRRHPFG